MRWRPGRSAPRRPKDRSGRARVPRAAGASVPWGAWPRSPLREQLVHGGVDALDRKLREALAHLAAAAAVVAAGPARVVARDDAMRRAPRSPFLLAAGP